MRRSASLLITGLVATFLGAQAPEVHGIHPADFDRSIAPCEDFFQFANGGWLKANPIPGDQATWGGFNEVDERNCGILHTVLEEAAASRAPEGTVPRKVGDFFKAGMDAKAIAKAGLSPLKAELARIDGLRDVRALAVELGRFASLGAYGAFHFGVTQDDRNSTAYIAELNQGGIGLPDRDYYLNGDARSQELRAKYLAFLARILELSGEKGPLAQAHAHVVFDLEKRLAQASLTRVEMRDPQALYHKLSLKELRAQAPEFPWDAYFQEMGFKGQDALLVRTPGFFKALSATLKEVPLPQWKTFLKVHLLSSAAPYLGEAFEKAHFDFYDAALTGAREMSPRWKRVLRVEDECLGEALGQMYVARAFTPQAKARAKELVGNVRAALRDRIAALDWMTGPTKEAALHKLDTVMVKIGYPDVWRDYSSLKVEPAAYLANVQRAAAFTFRFEMGKLGKPLDRTEWDMTPSTVNAYYNPLMNEIVFPAGILQPPFFDAQADDAVNYGAIGMVIGHELTHGFDDEGCQYDADGNLKDWWTDADRKAYAARTDLVVKQYDAIEALPGLHINGKLTLGENIADLGGLKIAYAALQKALEGKPRPAAIDGFTPEQRFFLGYAQSWHFHSREEAARMRVVVDPHSPAKARVNAPLANLPEFAQAFGCQAIGPMNRPLALRPSIW